MTFTLLRWLTELPASEPTATAARTTAARYLLCLVCVPCSRDRISRDRAGAGIQRKRPASSCCAAPGSGSRGRSRGGPPGSATHWLDVEERLRERAGHVGCVACRAHQHDVGVRDRRQDERLPARAGEAARPRWCDRDAAGRLAVADGEVAAAADRAGDGRLVRGLRVVAAPVEA